MDENRKTFKIEMFQIIVEQYSMFQITAKSPEMMLQPCSKSDKLNSCKCSKLNAFFLFGWMISSKLKSMKNKIIETHMHIKIWSHSQHILNNVPFLKVTVLQKNFKTPKFTLLLLLINIWIVAKVMGIPIPGYWPNYLCIWVYLVR